MSRSPEIVGWAIALCLAATGAEAGKIGLGREATPAEVAGWNLSVRPDGQGLPAGHGTAREGEAIFQAQCSSCHGEFGEGKGRFPSLAGGLGSLKQDRPDKTVGSYWPDASTIFDYIRRAMPFGNAQSLTSDQVYALTAYILNLNDIVKDPAFELNQGNFASIKMPNAGGFYDDDRDTSEAAFWNRKPCMTGCKGSVEITNRATIIDVTPDAKTGPKVE